MSRLQLMAFIENIPLNIKNGMRCAKKIFFIILAAACQRLKYGSYQGS